MQNQYPPPMQQTSPQPRTPLSDRFLTPLLVVFAVGYALILTGVFGETMRVSARILFLVLGPLLLLLDLGSVVLLDRPGYFSIGGLIDLPQRTRVERNVVFGFCLLLFPLALALYFIRRYQARPRPARFMPPPVYPEQPSMYPPMPPSGPMPGAFSSPMAGSAPVPMSPYPYPPPLLPSVQPVVIVQPPPAQMIRVYTGHLRSAQHKFQKDANKLARQGWRVQQVVTTQLSAAGVFVAPGVGIGKSKAHKLTVIYQR